MTAQHRLTSRSIPARAGEPSRNPRRQSLPTVYPRACGGTYPPTSVDSPPTGLSPRVRGNLRGRNAYPITRRSIPARAGEPWRGALIAKHGRVYPRACGGTIDGLNNRFTDEGLSPRVRGNQLDVAPAGTEGGSIPARAGEPRTSARGNGKVRVYPRACGGTVIVGQKKIRRMGLSPRVRGNLPVEGRVVGAVGSIPARAGEPLSDNPMRRDMAVYPRACGGTSSKMTRLAEMDGLSPRVRGNRWQAHQERTSIGSIPARAGEPGQRAPSPPPDRVYPRACGGTPRKDAWVSAVKGLSPRVRGNRHRHGQQHIVAGSIPARAGEPRSLPIVSIISTVYPRACGGT